MSEYTAQEHVRPFVYETRTKKALHFSICEIQSSMDLRRPNALDLEYTRIMMGFLLFQPAPLNLAMIGLGGGSLAKFCHCHLPATQISVVEINPHVIALRQEFHVPPDCERFRVIRDDGAHFVRAARGRFNVLLADGYDHQGLPGQLGSQDFYDDCFEALEPEGILVANLLVGHRHYRQSIERIRNSFRGAILVVDDRDCGNGVVFASKGCLPAVPRTEPLRCPAALDEPAWKSLQGAFARVHSAMKETPA